MLVEAAEKIGKSYSLDYWREKDHLKAPPVELWRDIGKAGFIGGVLPESQGGSNLKFLDLVLIIESLCAQGGGVPLAQLFMVNTLFGAMVVSRFSSPDQQRELLPSLLAGETIFSFAMTEPNAGNNALGMTMTAKPGSQRSWRVSGQKTWITLGRESEKMLLVVRTTPIEEVEKKTHGLSIFLVNSNSAGITYYPIEKTGTKCLPSYNVFFDDVLLTEANLIGKQDGGWGDLISLLNLERMITSAGLIGAGKLSLKLASNYVKERKIFGDAPTGSYQGVQFPLASAFAQITAAALMNRAAAWRYDSGLAFESEANIGKYLAAESTNFATDRSIQVLGGVGFSEEYHVERLWRDSRIFSVAPIPQEMILSFIAMRDLGLPKSY